MPFFLTLLFFALISSATACDRCLHRSKAAYYQDEAAGLYTGACGYGNLTSQLSNGFYAAALPSIYKQGARCGSCFKIRCKDKRFCCRKGSRVVVTDRNGDTNIGFVMSQKAFAAMARKGQEEQLLTSGIVDVEYKRVHCPCKNKTLLVRVEEWSQYPSYLALKFLHLGGQTEIVAIHIAQVNSTNWSSMSRNYGAVWDIRRELSQGALQMRMIVRSGYDGRWIWAKELLPVDWIPGATYDTGLRIHDIAKEKCPPSQCAKPWK